MKTIFYGMCGEGRGHAARVRTIVDRLRNEYRFVLFAPEQAFDFLAEHYAASNSPSESAAPQNAVEVRRIPGLRFHYAAGVLDFPRTAWNAANYWYRLPDLVRKLRKAIREERPDLVITDFEPALPRAAKKENVPFISLDHQHFLVACDLSSLPPELRRWASAMNPAVRWHARGRKKTIVSSFFPSRILPEFGNVTAIGPLVREDLARATPQIGDHVTAYLRSNASPRMLEMLASLPCEVRVYGLGVRNNEGNLRFRRLNDRTFADDLISCRALVGAAGNQSLGEAIHLGKPVFALPEETHFEQSINAHFLAQMGAGDFAYAERATGSQLRAFFARIADFRERMLEFAGRIDGTPQALREIRGCFA